MNTPVPLSQQLAEAALANSDHPATAASALMSGAAAILQRDFGPETAAQLMLDMVTAARMSLIEGGLVAEATKH